MVPHNQEPNILEQDNDIVTQGSVTEESDVLEPDNTSTTSQELYTLEQDSITGSQEPDLSTSSFLEPVSPVTNELNVTGCVILESDAQFTNNSLYPGTSSRESGSDSTIDSTSRHSSRILGKV